MPLIKLIILMLVSSGTVRPVREVVRRVLNVKSLGKSFRTSPFGATGKISRDYFPEQTCCAAGAAELLRSENGLQWRRLFLGKARLGATRRTSYILAAFSLSTMTELQLDIENNVPVWLFTVFAVNTVVLITVHVFSLIISTCLLPTMSAISEEYELTSNNRQVIPVPSCSPHGRLGNLISLSVTLSTVLGLLLFLLEVCLLTVIKFWDYTAAAWAGSLVMVPAVVMFLLFCWHFNKMLYYQAYETRREEIRELQDELRRTEEDLYCGNCAENEQVSMSRF